MMVAERNCDKHGKYEAVFHLLFDKKIETGCPQCIEDENKRRLEAQEKAEAINRAQEAERAQKEWQDTIKAMNVEPAYEFASLSNYVAETKDQETAKRKFQDLIDGKIHKILATGTNGTGKTHLACAAVIALRGRIMTMYEISVTIRASYTTLATSTEFQIVDALASVPLLAIDEIGRTKGGEAEANWLSYIIDKRHARGLPLVLISNGHVKKDCPENGCPKCLENYMGEDIISRLSEDAVILRFSGEDYRKKKRGAPRA